MMKHNSIRRTATLALCLLIPSMMAARPAAAFNPQPEPPGVTAFGVAESQTAAIHVAYGFRDPLAEVGGIQPEPFRVGIAFYDANGRVVAGTVRSIGLGRIETLDVSASELGIRKFERRILYAVVECLDEVKVRVACQQSLSVTLELYDSHKGGTLAIVSGAKPAIVPVIAAAGIAR